MIKCEVCGAMFEKRKFNQKFCSLKCGRTFSNAKFRTASQARKAVKPETRKNEVEQVVYKPVNAKKTVVIPIIPEQPIKHTDGVWMKPISGAAQSHLVIAKGTKLLVTACHVSLNSTLAVKALSTTARCFECYERCGGM